MDSLGEKRERQSNRSLRALSNMCDQEAANNEVLWKVHDLLKEQSRYLWWCYVAAIPFAISTFLAVVALAIMAILILADM